MTQEFCTVMDQSYSGAIVVGITNLSRLVVARQPMFTHLHASSPGPLFNLYEYNVLTGRDYWDLLVTTPPALVDPLIPLIEDKALNSFPSSMQKIYYPKYRALLYSLFKMFNQTRKANSGGGGIKASSSGKFRPIEELCRLEMSRAMSVISFAIQRSLDLEQVCGQQPSCAYKNAQNVLMIKSNVLQMIVNGGNNGSGNNGNEVQNLSTLISDLLDENKMQMSSESMKYSSLNEIIAHLTQNKLYQITVNQQVCKSNYLIIFQFWNIFENF